MRLSFEREISNDGTTEQVYPIVAETGDAIEDVIECTVYSSIEGLTQMTITVDIRNGNKYNGK